MFAALAISFGVAACGDDDEESADSGETTEQTTPTDDGGETGEGGATEVEPIQANPDNEAIEITVGSKNFNEQYVLGEIYAQALEAAGYTVETDLSLGSEQVALKALESGEVDAYPEYTSTALTSFFEFAPEDVPGDAQQAYEETQDDFAELGLQAFPPTPFSSANAVGLLTETAEEFDLSTISDLEGVSQDLTLAGSPECRQRIDCLVGLEQNYGLEFAKFTPVDIGLRYTVLDKGDADLSILFTTDALLYNEPETYTILEDDQGVLPAGNVIFVASQETVEEAGPDFAATIESVQQNLTLPVMQELNSRMEIDKEKPADAAAAYLQEFGYIE
jgi:glycine betaine/choline ABC-type transport system substrate-binding protein